jgi:hypothetical protein
VFLRNFVRPTPEITNTASSKLIDQRKSLDGILVAQTGDEIGLLWEHVLLLVGVHKPRTV